MEHKHVNELLEQKRDLQCQIRDIDSKLCRVVTDFEGKLTDALKLGLVRLNFTAPPGFKRFLMEKE